jgi:predicted O-methyltransferase YrrM
MTTEQQTEARAPGLTEDDLQLLARHLLKRPLRPGELVQWTRRAARERMGFHAAFEAMVALPEYLTRAGVNPEHPPGHYYSPVVNPEELRGHFSVNRDVPVDDLPGLAIRDADLRAEFDLLSPHMRGLRFPETKADSHRFYAANGIFPLGDAIILAAMIGRHRPRRVIEIGSGFSTAAMLDAIGHFGLDTRITCIEPYPARLRANLRPEDAGRVTILEQMVQRTDPALFSALQAGDILFIDSTHVAKTGSDVCYEMFEALPRLAPGVLVHVHDIQYPFEYPDIWIFERRRSWNEIYMLRAFLMYNDRFRVVAFNNYFGRRHRQALEAAYGEGVANVGGGIWMQVAG